MKVVDLDKKVQANNSRKHSRLLSAFYILQDLVSKQEIGSTAETLWKGDPVLSALLRNETEALMSHYSESVSSLQIIQSVLDKSSINYKLSSSNFENIIDDAKIIEQITICDLGRVDLVESFVLLTEIYNEIRIDYLLFESESGAIPGVFANCKWKLAIGAKEDYYKDWESFIYACCELELKPSLAILSFSTQHLNRKINIQAFRENLTSFICLFDYSYLEALEEPENLLETVESCSHEAQPDISEKKKKKKRSRTDREKRSKSKLRQFDGSIDKDKNVENIVDLNEQNDQEETKKSKKKKKKAKRQELAKEETASDLIDQPQEKTNTLVKDPEKTINFEVPPKIPENLPKIKKEPSPNYPLKSTVPENEKINSKSSSKKAKENLKNSFSIPSIQKKPTMKSTEKGQELLPPVDTDSNLNDSESSSDEIYRNLAKLAPPKNPKSKSTASPENLRGENIEIKSQSNINPSVSLDNSQWICKGCQFINSSPKSKRCKICNLNKEAVLNQQANQEQRWTCKNCTFSNSPKTYICEMCNTSDENLYNVFRKKKNKFNPYY